MYGILFILLKSNTPLLKISIGTSSLALYHKTISLNFFHFIYFFEREREHRENFHPLVHSLKCPQWPGTEATSQEYSSGLPCGLQE